MDASGPAVCARLTARQPESRSDVSAGGRQWRFPAGVFGPVADTREVFSACRGQEALSSVFSGRNATVISYNSHELLLGPDFGGFYDEPDEASVGLAQQLLLGLYATIDGRVCAASELPEGGHAVSVGCVRVARAGASVDLLAATSPPPASAEEATDLLADAYSRGRATPGHTVVSICVTHRPLGCHHAVVGTLRLIDLDHGAEGDLHQISSALQQLAGRNSGFPGAADADLLARLRLEDVLTGRSTCHAVVTVDGDAGGDSASSLQACRVGTCLQQLLERHTPTGHLNDLSVASHNLSKVLRQQQREHSALKLELARREIKAARTSHRGTWDHLAAGPSVVPDSQLSDELARVVAGLPDTMGSLRALCALVPRSKATFTQMGGVRALTELIDFALHGGNTSYNAVYTIAALCDDGNAAQEGLDCGVLGRVLGLLGACKEDHVREGCAMTVDQLCVADIHTDPELRRLIPMFITILQETENQQVQYRYLSALSRILGKLSERAGADLAGPPPPHRATSLYDPKVLLAKAVDLLASPVKEVQTAAAQLIDVLLEVLGTLHDPSLANRILERLLTMTTERSVHLPTLASQCISKLVELPSLAREFAEGGRLRARHRSKCVDCVARASCASSPVSQFGSALLRVDGNGTQLYHTAFVLNCAWDAVSVGGPRQSLDVRANPQLRLRVQSATPPGGGSYAITFCMTLNEEGASQKPEQIFMGLDIYRAAEEDVFATATGRAVVLEDHASSPKHMSNYNLLMTVELEPSALPYIVIPYTDKAGVVASFSMAIISHDGAISVERADRPRYPVHTSRLLARTGGITSGGGLHCGDKVIAGSSISWRNNVQHMFNVETPTSCFVSLTKPSDAGPESATASTKLLVALVREDVGATAAAAAAAAAGLEAGTIERRRFVGSAFAARDESVVSISKISAHEATLACADLPPGLYTLLVLHDQPGQPVELILTSIFSSELKVHTCGAVADGGGGGGGGKAAGGKPQGNSSLALQLEWPIAFNFRGDVPVSVEAGLSSGQAEAFFSYPQILLEGDASLPLGRTEVIAIASCPEPDVYLGLTVVFDRKRKKQMLQRLSDSDTWMWGNEGDMQRTSSFTPLEAAQSFVFDAATDSVILIPTLYEGGRTAELTVSIYCASAAMTATALGEEEEEAGLRDIEGLLCRSTAGADSLLGTTQSLSVPLHLQTAVESGSLLTVESLTSDDDADDHELEGAFEGHGMSSSGSGSVGGSGAGASGGGAWAASRQQRHGAAAATAAAASSRPVQAAATDAAGPRRGAPPPRPRPGAAADSAAVGDRSAAATPGPSADEVAVAARAAALREASLRSDVVRAEEKAEAAQQELRETKAAAAAAAQAAQAKAASMASELEALAAQAAAAAAAEQRLARLTGEASALGSCTPKELKELRATLESSLEATNARIQLALIAERLQPDLVCPILQEVMIDPVVASDGNSYERTAIANWLLEHDKSPLSGERLDGVLLPNTRLRAIISELGLLVEQEQQQEERNSTGGGGASAAIGGSDI